MKWYKKQNDWYKNQKELYEKIHSDEEEVTTDLEDEAALIERYMETTAEECESPFKEDVYKEDVYSSNTNIEAEEPTIHHEVDERAGYTTTIAKDSRIVGDITSTGNLILDGTLIGNIECSSDLAIHGDLKGDLHCLNATLHKARIQGNVICDGNLELGEGSYIVGNVRADNIICAGRIKGDVDAEQLVSLASTAAILGDVKTTSIESNYGSILQGQVMIAKTVYIED
ncbi:MAG: polymer-forming cytoskeletal protein [Erysipelotrichaceae bacterium]